MKIKEIIEKYHISRMSLYLWTLTGKLKKKQIIENGRACNHYDEQEIKKILMKKGKIK